MHHCKNNGDYASAKKIFHALKSINQVNSPMVVAFMRTSRACRQPSAVLDLWHALPKLQIPQSTDIAINTLVACADVGTHASLQVGPLFLNSICPHLIFIYYFISDWHPNSLTLRVRP